MPREREPSVRAGGSVTASGLILRTPGCWGRLITWVSGRTDIRTLKARVSLWGKKAVNILLAVCFKCVCRWSSHHLPSLPYMSRDSIKWNLQALFFFGGDGKWNHEWNEKQNVVICDCAGKMFPLFGRITEKEPTSDTPCIPHVTSIMIYRASVGVKKALWRNQRLLAADTLESSFIFNHTVSRFTQNWVKTDELRRFKVQFQCSIKAISLNYSIWNWKRNLLCVL